MIERYEKGSLAETQDQICIDLAKPLKEMMITVPSHELLRKSITEKMPPNPIQEYEHDMTIHYLLKPFISHSGLTQNGAVWMLRIHTHDGMFYDTRDSISIVSVPIDESGKYILPDKFDGWQEAFEVCDYVGVLRPDYTKPNDDDVTVCRILLEDAQSIINESATSAVEPASR
ncbi:MAG TPA: hypothetical protein VFP32_00360 [Candidatus Saccharimonadales bacterium]|nr:hypothetical protein [Candidatus Saccharimonadales bacterium]